MGVMERRGTGTGIGTEERGNRAWRDRRQLRRWDGQTGDMEGERDEGARDEEQRKRSVWLGMRVIVRRRNDEGEREKDR